MTAFCRRAIKRPTQEFAELAPLFIRSQIGMMHSTLG
jgi:hypothetical protein